jgi:hypothetical protein
LLQWMLALPPLRLWQLLKQADSPFKFVLP